MQYAGFLRRAVAYLLDMIPITLVVGAAFYFLLGFDETLHRYLRRGPGDHEARSRFLLERNRIRDLSLGLYFLYSALMESSALHATLGKWLLGIAVVDEDGRPLSVSRSRRRNSAKVLSFLPLGLGCLWTIWSPRRQAWHDKIAHSLVVKRSTRSQAGGGGPTP